MFFVSPAIYSGLYCFDASLWQFWVTAQDASFYSSIYLV